MVCGPPLPPLLQHCSNSSVVVVPLVLTGCHLFLFKVHGTPFDIDCSEGEFSEYDEKGECPVKLSNLQSAFKVVSRPLHHLPANMVQFIYIIVAIARWKIDTTVIDNRWRSMRGVGRLDSSRPSDLETVRIWNRCINRDFGLKIMHNQMSFFFSVGSVDAVNHVKLFCDTVPAEVLPCLEAWTDCYILCAVNPAIWIGPPIF